MVRLATKIASLLPYRSVYYDAQASLLNYTTSIKNIFPRSRVETRERSELLEVTDKLCTTAIQLTGNSQETNEIARAVMDVAKWWP